MPNEAESNVSISTIPYRYDPGIRGDCGISYFVDNGFSQGILSVQNSGTANHQSLSITNAYSGVRSENVSDVLS